MARRTLRRACGRWIAARRGRAAERAPDACAGVVVRSETGARRGRVAHRPARRNGCRTPVPRATLAFADAGPVPLRPSGGGAERVSPRAADARRAAGIEPSLEVQALEAAILRHEVPPIARSARRGQPAGHVDPGSSAARARSRLCWACSPSIGVVTLTGVGGVGKTRLALEAARDSLGESPRTASIFVDLAPGCIAPTRLSSIDRARSLDIREQSGATAGSVESRPSCAHRTRCARPRQLRAPGRTAGSTRSPRIILHGAHRTFDVVATSRHPGSAWRGRLSVSPLGLPATEATTRSACQGRSEAAHCTG